MTDVEFFELSVLFEGKKLTKVDLETLDRWVVEYERGGWASPSDLIIILANYPDR